MRSATRLSNKNRRYCDIISAYPANSLLRAHPHPHARPIPRCGDDPPAVTTPPPDPSVPTTLSITPESIVFTAVGDTARFTAQVRDQNGNAMTGATVSWASTDPSVASVSRVDEGTSHSLQFPCIYVDHRQLRQNPFEYDYPAAIAYLDFNSDGHVNVFHSTPSGSMDRLPAQVYISDGVGGFDIAPAFLGDHPGGIAPPQGPARRLQR